ncbi:hypothetical protein [Pedobacter sp. MR2016-24]|uniref:hypothetical protein n=1 Tax=Pedobacter sp. MR2016-24 TaxID=2994466 RepID=UPI00224653B5|nr:hypothetical protein [Pedobacter sp. MR2016-24]MCX2484788.1 hypothetical protein [Pedobacter sp. MR2016-24]
MENLGKNTRAYVLDALDSVNQLRTFQTVNHPEREELDLIAIRLEVLSSELLKDDIKRVAENIQSTLPDLIALNERLLKTYAKLKSISGKIARAAEVAGVFVEIVSKAAAAGII